MSPELILNFDGSCGQLLGHLENGEHFILLNWSILGCRGCAGRGDLKFRDSSPLSLVTDFASISVALKELFWCMLKAAQRTALVPPVPRTEPDAQRRAQERTVPRTEPDAQRTALVPLVPQQLCSHSLNLRCTNLV